MKLATIGFTQKGAEKFFTLIKTSGVKRIVDVRLNNVSQLSAFAKRDDLKYFLKVICGIDYTPAPNLTPTKEMLDAYKKDHRNWDRYEKEFLGLMEERKIENIKPETLENSCLLCSEHEPHHCHRRLVADYLRGRWGDFDVDHLV